jgi:hypothetical protein
MSLEKKGRGRPRKNFENANDLSELKNESKSNSSQANDLEIDKTDFDFYEPESFTSPTVEQFNPLADAPIKREYATPKIQEGIQGEIVEPTFHQPTFNNNAKPVTPIVDGNGAPSSQPFKNPNPALNEVDNAEKKVACEQMVDAALDLYETAWGLGGRLAQVSEEKLQSLINDGSINPKRRIPVEDSSVSIFEFFQNYNNQVVEASKVDSTFKKKVRPPLVRVFMKNGWGMTDEQFLGIAFAKDSLMRGISLFQMKKSINALINQLSEENSENKPVKTPKKKPTPPPTQEEIITPEIEDIFDDDDFLQEDEIVTKNTPPSPPPKQTDKFDINFADNPLRQDTRREPPAPKVEEFFQKGGEIIDEQKNTNE